MWKIIVGFVLFAAVSMYVIIMAGDKADMGGEKHGGDAIAHHRLRGDDHAVSEDGTDDRQHTDDRGAERQ